MGPVFPVRLSRLRTAGTSCHQQNSDYAHKHSQRDGAQELKLCAVCVYALAGVWCWAGLAALFAGACAVHVGHDGWLSAVVVVLFHDYPAIAQAIRTHMPLMEAQASRASNTLMGALMRSMAYAWRLSWGKASCMVRGNLRVVGVVIASPSCVARMRLCATLRLAQWRMRKYNTRTNP